MVKYIPLSRGKTAIIDDEDFERVSKMPWHCISTGYAAHTRQTGYNEKGKRTKITILLHRYLMNAPKGMIVDHINRNPLDCRKANLRVVTHSQSLANRGKNKNGVTSKYRGVWWDKAKGKYCSGIKKNYKYIHIGYYDCEADAALAYNQKAKELFNENAGLSIVTECKCKLSANKKAATIFKS